MRESASKVRLQRVLADAGVAARRACETLIEEGRVRVNGQSVRRLPAFVDPESDRIEVDGRLLPRRPRSVYVMVHKPGATLVSAQDETGLGRRTVADLVDHPSAGRLFPVGRLDYDTFGLLLLTNDGDLANRLTHPRYGVTRTYQAVLKGTFTEDQARAVHRQARLVAKRETALAGQKRRREATGPIPAPRKLPPAPPVQLRTLPAPPGKTLLEVTLVEGRRRPLLEVLLSAGLNVKKLTRTAIGPLLLKGLAVGHWRELTRDESRLIRAAAAGRAPHRAGGAGGPRRRGRRRTGAPSPHPRNQRR